MVLHFFLTQLEELIMTHFPSWNILALAWCFGGGTCQQLLPDSLRGLVSKMRLESEGMYRHLSPFAGLEWMATNCRNLSWMVKPKASLESKDQSNHQARHGGKASLGMVWNSWQSALPWTLISCSVKVNICEGHPFLVEQEILL